jgi:prepilin-type processing-associated H-X9-DG protein
MSFILNNLTLTIVMFVLFVFFILPSIRTVEQGHVVVTTIFGKYRRVMRPGLHLLIPLIEKINKRISIQNRSTELEFQAITQDQANVYFKAMLLWSVVNDDEESIKNVAFKFISEDDLKKALERSVEGATRGFVALRKQSEILSLRSEIVKEVKEQLDDTLKGWGYHLIDLQLNDIRFDEKVTESMAQVVASMNLKAAATNEGDALLIKRTKEAQAEGASITIAAEAEKKAAELRGEGVALFREKVSSGLANSAEELRSAKVDDKLLLFSIWTEAMMNIAEKGKGNVLFFDGSTGAMENEIKRMIGINQVNLDNK